MLDKMCFNLVFHILFVFIKMSSACALFSVESGRIPELLELANPFRPFLGMTVSHLSDHLLIYFPGT